MTYLNRSIAAAALVAFGAAACGGGSSPAPTPSPNPTPGSTITITAAGVSPKTLDVAIGTQVTFINNDTRSHEMNSDPHPDHTDCPELNQVGFIQPGQQKQTGNLVLARTCGYHDHNLSTVTSLQGNIVIR